MWCFRAGKAQIGKARGCRGIAEGHVMGWRSGELVGAGGSGGMDVAGSDSIVS